jgi:hypothetical protein
MLVIFMNASRFSNNARIFGFKQSPNKLYILHFFSGLIMRLENEIAKFRESNSSIELKNKIMNVDSRIENRNLLKRKSDSK